MSKIKGSVNVTGPIAPVDTTDVYPTHNSEYGKGGYREVDTILQRDAITPERRKMGMLVNVAEEDTIYKLVGGILNSNWTSLATSLIITEIDGGNY